MSEESDGHDLKESEKKGSEEKEGKKVEELAVKLTIKARRDGLVCAVISS